MFFETVQNNSKKSQEYYYSKTVSLIYNIKIYTSWENDIEKKPRNPI